MNLLEVDNLAVSFGENHVLKQVSFTAAPNELVFLVGANGCGKTTLLKSLVGDIAAKYGEVDILGLNPLKERRSLLKRIGVVFAESHLPPDLQIRDIYRLCLEAHSIHTPSDAFCELADKFGVMDFWDRYAGTLSSGEMRKIMIALSLVHAPDILIFDEVNNFLDPLAKIELKSFLEAYAADAKNLVLFATHDYSLFFMNKAKVMVLDGGKINQLPITLKDHVTTRNAIVDLENTLKSLLKEGGNISNE